MKLNNTWDNGYPSGGNYWSSYEGVDKYSGPHQNETGNDGIGDTPHILSAFAQDNYPLMRALGDTIKPVAEAMDSQGVVQGTKVQLNGWGYDNLIYIKSYVWTFTDVAPKTLIGQRCTYTFNNTGDFKITLNVTDHGGNWDTDTTWVYVSPDTIAPVANAGPNQTIVEHTPVTFDGSASLDNVGIVSYEWDFGDGAKGTGEITTHTYAKPGSYTATLTVKDIANNSNTNSTTIVVRRDTDRDKIPDITDPDDDNDFWPDFMDPMPQNALFPDVIVILVLPIFVIAIFFKLKKK